ncbi:MAG: ABC transporter ATP-binding protein, partial [Verrucomicrobiales bacterium]|nr:ABC transporter ATP-binding protein [Verrucomicrobiales bacterium]
DFAKYTTRLGKAAAAAERIHEILETTPDVVDRPDAVPAPRLRGDVSFRGVSFGYDAAHAHLHDVSFEVPAGARVAVVGASGSGKSTLLRLILRLVEPRSGVVRFDGRDVREFTVESVRRQIGVVLQDTALFAGTVRDNIALGVAHATDEAIEAAARLAQAHEFVVRLPRGYDTEIGERGVALSQGQRQRLAIARAALRDTPLLLLDEPVTGLDPLNAAALAEALAGLGAERTVFWITHDLAEARGADLVLHLHDGRLVEAGTHAELIRKGGRYAELVRRTSRSERNDHAFHA